MNEAQYQQLVLNSRPRGMKILLTEERTGWILGAAAKSIKRRERARRALEQLLDSELSRKTQVTSFSRGSLEIEAKDPIALARLKKRRHWLTKQLMRNVPGLRSLNVRQYNERCGSFEENAGTEATVE